MESRFSSFDRGDSTAHSSQASSGCSGGFDVIRSYDTTASKELSINNANNDKHNREFQTEDAQDEKITLESASESGSHGKENWLSNMKCSMINVKALLRIPWRQYFPASGKDNNQMEQYFKEVEKLRILRHKEYKERKKKKIEEEKLIKEAHCASENLATETYFSQRKGQDSSTIHSFGQDATSSPSQSPLGNSRSFASLQQSSTEAKEFRANDAGEKRENLPVAPRAVRIEGNIPFALRQAQETDISSKDDDFDLPDRRLELRRRRWQATRNPAIHEP